MGWMDAGEEWVRWGGWMMERVGEVGWMDAGEE